MNRPRATCTTARLALAFACAFAAMATAGCRVKKGQPSAAELQRAVAKWNATAEPREKILCRREPVPNSHFKEVVCRYKWQLDDGNLEGRAPIDELVYRNTTLTSGPSQSVE